MAPQPILSFQNSLNASAQANELSIRGAAGPYCVIASNFAPGTTAADIESVMAPIGGEMLGCKIISSTPTVIVEMVFVDRSGADNVIAMFNNKKVRTQSNPTARNPSPSLTPVQADGRMLYVYMKENGPSLPLNNPVHSHPFQPSAPVASPHPVQQPAEDGMDMEPEPVATENLLYVESLDPTPHPHSHGDDAPRGPRDTRETYRPPHDDRQPYHNDYSHGPRHNQPEVQDGRYGFADQNYSRGRPAYNGGGGGGGGYNRDDRRGRFREDGRMYSDSMGGRGGGGGGGGRWRR